LTIIEISGNVSGMARCNFELLRDRRDELDLSISDIAASTGRSYGYIANILYGRDEPGQATIYALERAVGLPKGALTAERPQGDPSEPPAQPPNRRGPSPKRKPKGSAEVAA
jgi:transcriptional regulator with XRE-family HTH domain